MGIGRKVTPATSSACAGADPVGSRTGAQRPRELVAGPIDSGAAAVPSIAAGGTAWAIASIFATCSRSRASFSKACC